MLSHTTRINEADKQKIPLPPVTGKVQFEDLQFRFQPGSKVLKDINLTIPSDFHRLLDKVAAEKYTYEANATPYSPEQGRIPRRL